MTRTRLLSTASAMACAAAAMVTAAYAQDASTETVIVTGSRLSTGFSAPTPVTALSSDELTQTSSTNIAMAISELPAFNGSSNASRTTGGSPNGTNGQSLLNLRGLGTQRVLVLLDGQRLIATNSSGSTDVNTLPQSLVKSVEVVTGGASAAYGSDAVSGVVNFILDTHFEGLKGTVQGGISTYGDSDSYKANVTWGDNFMGGKLHVVATGEGFYMNPINFYTDGGRKWETNPAGLVNDPVTGERLILSNVRDANADYGGLITGITRPAANGGNCTTPVSTCPLVGTQFRPDGTPTQHDYGNYFSAMGAPYTASQFGIASANAFQIGGVNAERPQQPLSPRQLRVTGFAHADYDLDNNTTLFAEASLAWSNVVQEEYPNYAIGQFNYTVFSGNAYLPASIQSTMTANNVSSFSFGRTLADLPTQQDDATQQLQRYHIGAKGRVFGDWSWDANYIHSISNQNIYVNYIYDLRNIYAAADAVVNPSSGQIVCRSQYYNAANVFVAAGTGLDPACVPTNIFGAGVGLGTGHITQAGQNYIFGSSIRWLMLQQDIVDLSLSGELPENFSLGAGPVSVATGFTYRGESSSQKSDARSQGVVDCTGVRGCPASVVGRAGGWQTFDPVPFSGDYNVNEGFLELGVPVLKNVPMAEALDLNVAGRYAYYSNAGQALSWKIGATWRPIADVLVRATESRDLRAPNVLELFNPRSTNAANITWRVNCGIGPCGSLASAQQGSATTAYTGISYGSTDLQPEKAVTMTMGVVYQPSWFTGFNISVDWFKIKLNNAIAQLGGQNIADQCQLYGVAADCALIVQNAGTPLTLTIKNPELNLNSVTVKGVDLEASYNTDLGDLGTLNLHALASYLAKYSTLSVGASGPVNNLDTKDGRVPWQATLNAQYRTGPLGIAVSERYIGDGRYDQTLIQGIKNATGINNNSTTHIYYTDLNISYDFMTYSVPMTGYFLINNLWGQDPPAVPGPSTFQQPTNAQLYDTMGRYFTLGLRFKM